MAMQISYPLYQKVRCRFTPVRLALPLKRQAPSKLLGVGFRRVDPPRHERTIGASSCIHPSFSEDPDSRKFIPVDPIWQRPFRQL